MSEATITIDEQRFRQLCEEAWKRTEAELDWKDWLSEQSTPQVPFLFRLKNMLCEFFGFKDDIESVLGFAHIFGDQGITGARYAGMR